MENVIYGRRGVPNHLIGTKKLPQNAINRSKNQSVGRWGAAAAIDSEWKYLVLDLLMEDVNYSQTLVLLLDSMHHFL